MKRLLLFVLLCCTHLFLSAQEIQYAYYSYSFRGNTDFERLESQVINIEGISRCKIKVKEKHTNDIGGEILFEVPWQDVPNDKTPGPDILFELKKIVLQANLEPMDFKKLQRTETKP